MTTTKKKIKKAKSRHLFRNARNAATAAVARRPPRAVVVRPGGPIAADLEAAEEATEGKKKVRNGPGWNALKAAGGALATTIAGAYLAQQDLLPPKIVTGVVSGLGLLLALEGPNPWKSLGLGAMAAAGGQLGFMLIDDQLIKSTDDDDKKAQPASKPATTTTTASTPATRQASDIPADALARAYERARLRMALTSDRAN